MTFDLEVPVLIVGGGRSGLTASMLLSHLGVESLLVSRYPETSRYPKAHVLNQRSMEIFTISVSRPRSWSTVHRRKTCGELAGTRAYPATGQVTVTRGDLPSSRDGVVATPIRTTSPQAPVRPPICR